MVQKRVGAYDGDARATSGRSSAWLEHRVWDAEVAGSNPAAPIWSQTAEETSFSSATSQIRRVPHPACAATGIRASERRARIAALAASLAALAVGLAPAAEANGARPTPLAAYYPSDPLPTIVRHLDGAGFPCLRSSTSATTPLSRDTVSGRLPWTGRPARSPPSAAAARRSGRSPRARYGIAAESRARRREARDDRPARSGRLDALHGRRAPRVGALARALGHRARPALSRSPPFRIRRGYIAAWQFDEILDRGSRPRRASLPRLHPRDLYGLYEGREAGRMVRAPPPARLGFQPRMTDGRPLAPVAQRIRARDF